MDKELKEHGKDVVVIDHHEAERYSENAIVVNNQLSERYPNKSLCGAGVVYKLLMVLDEKILRPDKAGYAKHFIDLCALANIADCMSMKAPETRYYIVEGLKQINNEGFKALIDQQSFSLFKENDTLNYISIAFYIAPLINAVIRVGTMKEKEMFELTTPQKSIWMMEQFYKGTNINNICATLTINKDVDIEKLNKAINIFVQNNKSFGLNFKLINGELKQYFTK